MIKRWFDLIASSIGIVTIIPLLALIAIAIKLDSKGPVLFTQERVGRHGAVFRILKFRTMRSGSGGRSLTVGCDPRVTRVGSVLRKYKLDELPQLLNVLFGQMSLVGPRPEIAKYVAYYPSDVRDVVLSVRPGITDPASIAYIDEAHLLGRAADPERMYIETVLPVKVSEYVKYARGNSFKGDILIICRTICEIFRRQH